jgi:YfiH family protein
MADVPLAARFRARGLDWIVPAWQAPARVHAFATTRNGGVSQGAGASLDVGGAREGDDAAIAENRRRIGEWLPAPPVWLEQVHGAAVVVVERGNAGELRDAPARADALVTRLAGCPLAIRVADCIPVLLAARDGGTIGAAHAGWRGLAAGVVDATLDAMRVPPRDIVAWLGPAIGAKAFEVGDDVRDAFAADGAGAFAHFARHREGKWLCDLRALARRRLAAAGVTAVDADTACTHDDRARFFSYRRDGATGRMAAFIWRDDP